MATKDLKEYGVDKPVQRIPTSQKIGKGEKALAWRIQNVDFFGDLNGDYSKYRMYMESLFKMAAGHLDDESYNFITAPSNTNKRKSQRKAQGLNNYDIVTPIVHAFMGDKIDRMIKPTVTAINSDIESIKDKERSRLINQQLEKVFQVEIEKLQGLGVSEEEILKIQDIDKLVGNIKDEKSITGAKALEYILINNEVFRKFRKMFFYWIVSNQTYSIKNVLHKDIEYEPVSPLNTSFNMSDGQDFVEDGESASVKFHMTNSEILDKHYDQLDKKDLDVLEGKTKVSTNSKTVRYSDRDEMYNRLVNKGLVEGSATLYAESLNSNTVTYVNWKSLVKIGKLTLTDISGEEIEVEVDEDYKPLKGEKIEWRWVNQVWEGYKINDEIYFGIQPVPFQRSKFDNPSSCKLLINGRIFMNTHYRHKSVVERLQPYQKRYNVVSYHLEKLIHKNKDKIVLMPYGLIPDNEDLNIFDMMYYADTDSFMFVDDESDKNKIAAMQNVRVLDLSLSQNMSFLSELLRATKAQAEESIGFNRQRLGDTNSSDGKGVNEDAVQRSNIITSEIFEEFEEFEEREWQGLLDISKFAWEDGKKAAYISSEQRRAVLEIDKEYRELEMGVRATRSSRELRKLEKLRSEANQQAMLQNGAVTSTIARMENVDSLSELEQILVEEEEKILQRNQAAQEAEQQAVQQAEATKAKSEEAEREYKYYKTDADNVTKENVAIISANSSMLNSSDPSSSITAPEEFGGESSSSRRTEEVAKNQIERDKLILKQQELQIKRETNKVKLENPVVGEK